VRHPNSESTATAAGSSLTDVPSGTALVQNSSGQAIPQNSLARNPAASYVYVVQPQDTLRDLCLSTLGRYDSAVLSKIRELNPGLKNPEHLYAGQEIRLPTSPTK
jgi:phage tail protein X